MQESKQKKLPLDISKLSVALVTTSNKDTANIIAKFAETYDETEFKNPVHDKHKYFFGKIGKNYVVLTQIVWRYEHSSIIACNTMRETFGEKLSLSMRYIVFCNNCIGFGDEKTLGTLILPSHPYWSSFPVNTPNSTNVFKTQGIASKFISGIVQGHPSTISIKETGKSGYGTIDEQVQKNTLCYCPDISGVQHVDKFGFFVCGIAKLKSTDSVTEETADKIAENFADFVTIYCT